MGNGLPIEMSKEQVSATRGPAAVGLVLSELDGSRCATIVSRLSANRQAAQGA